jgi:hypothetical protein
MKIALIGNMNNNNFALMRYFRDLGADAHLLLYSNDGTGTLSHFRPESDTWEIERWLPYIHTTPIPNAPISAFDFPLSWLWAFRALMSNWLGRSESCTQPISRRVISQTYSGYDKLIASGISPATLRRTGISLDIFYPYSTGVEFLNTGEFTSRSKRMFGLNRFIIDGIAQLQKSGIRSSKNVLNYEMGLTQDVLLNIGVQPHKLAIPMVYSKESLPENPPNQRLRDASSVIANSKFTLLHHSRLMWRNPGAYSREDWKKENKNNNWLIHSFADFLNCRRHLNPILFIVEYGPDVAVTKQLVAELGIEANIQWLPKMQRKELMWLLSRVTIGVGEFYDVPRTLWGGTGWECFVCGKPLLQGFNFVDGEFEQIYGHPPPSMLRVRRCEDILPSLFDMADNVVKREWVGKGGADWFDRYNGVSLARKWLELLTALPSQMENLKDARASVVLT